MTRRYTSPSEGSVRSRIGTLPAYGYRSYSRHPVAVGSNELSDERTLAWALIAAAKPSLNPSERQAIFVTIGSGDDYAAIGSTMDRLVEKGIPLVPSLIDALHEWLSRYADHDEEPRLRALLSQARSTRAS